MAEHDLAALLLTTEPEIRYFTGYLTRFWESPTRPWFLIVPAGGAPVAVIPSIGAALMATTWIADIRSWPSPDPADDGIGLLAGTLDEIAGAGRIGIPDGPETYLRLPLAGFASLTARIAGEIAGDAGIMRQLRSIKSPAEIDKIAAICAIAGRAFDRVPEIAAPGVPLDRIFRRFQMLGLEEGADHVPYLAGAAAPGGYRDVISPATERSLAPGDVLILDTGMVREGYFCDFDRNYSVGPPAPSVADAHARLIEAVDAAAEIARPGATAADLFHAMNRITGDTAPGRLGHGLGMQLTEGLSLMPGDRTVLEPGMVLTLEPVTATPGGIMVHEENIAITEGACRFLSPRAPRDMVVI